MKQTFSILACTILLLAGCGRPAAKKLDTVLEGAVINPRGEAVETGYALNTDYLLLYFSAHWCGPCRSFTPQLVEYYKSKMGGSLFQVLFISSDHSDAEMKNYMETARMPWPAVIYHSEARKAVKKRYAGSGIPQLVLLDRKGRVLADSFDGRKYLGPRHVLNELDQQLAARLEKGETDPAGLSETTGKTLPTPERIAAEYRIDGFGKTKSQNMAFINGELKLVGDDLGNGVIVEKITETYVEISYEKNLYKLLPQ